MLSTSWKFSPPASPSSAYHHVYGYTSTHTARNTNDHVVISSDNLVYTLVIQHDFNLVLYRATSSSQEREPLWSSNTSIHAAAPHSWQHPRHQAVTRPTCRVHPDKMELLYASRADTVVVYARCAAPRAAVPPCGGVLHLSNQGELGVVHPSTRKVLWRYFDPKRAHEAAWTYPRAVCAHAHAHIPRNQEPEPAPEPSGARVASAAAEPEPACSSTMSSEEVDHAEPEGSIVPDAALILHVGSAVAVFRDIHRQYPDFFRARHILATVHTQDLKERVARLLPPRAHVLVVDNVGADIGGFLSTLRFLRDASFSRTIRAVFKLHTKTDPHWRNQMIRPLHAQFRAIADATEQSVPVMYGAEAYVVPNKGINLTYGQDIVKRNVPHLLPALQEYMDEYHEYSPTRNCNTDLICNPTFYTWYEKDLKGVDGDQHWRDHGKNEFHRISNPHYIKRRCAKIAHFVAGTVFACNGPLLQHLMDDYDHASEIALLEPGYVRNTIERRTHAWEYIFGFLPYLRGGHLVSVSCDGTLTDKREEDEKNSARPFVPASRIHVLPWLRTRVAFFMLPPGSDPNSGGYRTLLRYICALQRAGICVDIYLGVCWNDHEVDLNVSVLDHFGRPTCSNWYRAGCMDTVLENISRYNEIDMSKHNFFVGFQCQHDYDILVANAWQVAEAVHRNKARAAHLVYIIQDLEYLFYPGDASMQEHVRATYKSDFHYYCLSAYLYGTMQEMVPRAASHTRSCLGYDSNKYMPPEVCLVRQGVVVAHYTDKPCRLPARTLRIIQLLSSRGVPCSVFPIDTKDRTFDGMAGVTCHPTMSTAALRRLYSTHAVGVVFSNSNPSRLGTEMLACGLQVVELDSPYTAEDLPSPPFHKVKLSDTEEDICAKVLDVLGQSIDITAAQVRKKYLESHTEYAEHTACVKLFQSCLA